MGNIAQLEEDAPFAVPEGDRGLPAGVHRGVLFQGEWAVDVIMGVGTTLWTGADNLIIV